MKISVSKFILINFGTEPHEKSMLRCQHLHHCHAPKNCRKLSSELKTITPRYGFSFVFDKKAHVFTVT